MTDEGMKISARAQALVSCLGRAGRMPVRWSQDQSDGMAALERLVLIATADNGQAIVVAKVLLGLFNGRRFPFDLTELRRLDDSVLADCLALMRMDARPVMELHNLLDGGPQFFAKLAASRRAKG
jgi:hypothetical protein